MIGLQHYLTVSAVLFALAVAGIFIKRRKNDCQMIAVHGTPAP